MLEKIIIPRELEEERRPISRPRLVIERTGATAPICLIATHRRVWNWITDDQSAAANDWKPPMGDNVYWLMAWKQGHISRFPVGWGAFFPKNGISAEAHFAFLPEVWGEQAQTAFRDMLRWISANTGIKRLVGEIPRSNSLAIKFARRAGFKMYAINERSICRKGKREDQLCFALDLV